MATLIVAMATSPAFARKGSHHHSKSTAKHRRPRPIGMTFHAIPTMSRSTEISGAFVEGMLAAAVRSRLTSAFFQTRSGDLCRRQKNPALKSRP
jgi:hypothetical protein